MTTPDASSEYDILRGYRDAEGRFTQLPGKREKKKQALMLRSLADHFDSARRYTEREINETLNAHHTFNDPASLRRLMFGSGLLDRTRDGRTYWVPAKQ